MKKFVSMFLLIGICLMASVGCSFTPSTPTPTEPTPDVDALVEAKLKKVVASLPTNTPYPTYTSVPIFRPASTQTPVPTMTPMPTSTPLPTPLPSFAPTPIPTLDAFAILLAELLSPPTPVPEIQNIPETHGQSSQCIYSMDGSSVSCGGQSSQCAYSMDGSSVSCGG